MTGNKKNLYLQYSFLKPNQYSNTRKKNHTLFIKYLWPFTLRGLWQPYNIGINSETDAAVNTEATRVFDPAPDPGKNLWIQRYRSRLWRDLLGGMSMERYLCFLLEEVSRPCAWPVGEMLPSAGQRPRTSVTCPAPACAFNIKICRHIFQLSLLVARSFYKSLFENIQQFFIIRFSFNFTFHFLFHLL